MNEYHNSELLQIIEAVAREKGIAKETLKIAMEQAIHAAARRKYGDETEIKVEINKNGEVKIYRLLEVVDDNDEDRFNLKISLKKAQEKQPGISLGEFLLEELPPIDLGRVSALAAKNIITQKVSEAERLKQYNDFKNKKGDLLSGIIKRIEYGNYIVELGRAEALLKRDQVIPNENFKIGDRVKAYVQDVRFEVKGAQIFLSRTDDNMLVKLFALEVPEIYENIISIKAVAREPGSKAKIAVYSLDTTIDPVGSCVGLRGSRVKSVTSELSGEKIDIILWNNNIAQFIINSMTPAEISKIILDEDKNRAEIIVPNDQLSIAIGRAGQNVKLASKLTGWKIDVMTEEQQSVKRNQEFDQATILFMKILDIDEVRAQLLASEGFSNIEQIANYDVQSLQSIEGFEDCIAEQIYSKAIQFIENKNEQIVNQLEKLGVEQNLLDIMPISPEEILILAEYGIKTIEDLGVIKLNEFKNLLPNTILSNSEIVDLIKLAREQTN